MSALFRRFEAQRLLHGIKICRNAPSITHMLFADDSYLFCKANVDESNRILELLQIYEEASGQKVNLLKSSIFFSTNVSQECMADISHSLQMSEADGNCKYLGLPNMMGRNKTRMLGFLKDKVNQRLQSWKDRWISQARREILIKSVAQTLPSYAMSVFLLPLEITKDFERSLAKFWWGSKPNNKAGKQGWRLATRTEGLASRLYKARYFPTENFFAAKLGNNPSYVWRSIWEAKSVVIDGARWNVGSGSAINILGQPWLQEEDNPFITTDLQGMGQAKVSGLMKVDGSQWDEEVVMDMFNSRDQQCIRKISLNGGGTDNLYWSKENSCEYSVKSAYRMLQFQKGRWQNADNDSLWRIVWQIKAPPKVLNLIWRALSHCLPTLTTLYEKYVPVNRTCPVCNGEEESILHALVKCPFASQCWGDKCLLWAGTTLDTFAEWLDKILGASRKDEYAEIVTLCWSIWKARNNVVWNKIKFSVVGVVNSTKQYLAEWTKAQKISTRALFQFVEEGDGACTWAKPQKEVVKIFVDAATFTESSSYGVGMLARDWEGKVVLGRSECYQGDANPEFAEAIAVKEALSWSKANRWEKVELESDCLTVVQAIRSRVTMLSPFGKVIMECRKLLSNSNIVLYFVRRSANMAAHFLARESCSFSGRVFDRGSVPVKLCSLLLADLME